jgi:hypothetical protein
MGEALSRSRAEARGIGTKDSKKPPAESGGKQKRAERGYNR